MPDSDRRAEVTQSARAGGPGGRVGSVRRGVTDWLRSVCIALLLFLVVRTWMIEAFKIPTASMEGTLLVGDFLLVNKALYGTTLPGLDLRMPGFAEPEWGDVVVFHPPHDPEKNYVKRIVGLPGDTLRMTDKRLFRNGARVDEPYARYVDRRGDAAHPDMQWQSHHLIASTRRRYEPTRDNWGPLVVPRERYFVLGDNRDNSEDSRYWGFVARDRIRGKPWRVYYSFEATSESRLAWLQSVRWNRLGAAIH